MLSTDMNLFRVQQSPYREDDYRIYSHKSDELKTIISMQNEKGGIFTYISNSCLISGVIDLYQQAYPV
jgi:hypothetical protein